MEDCPIQVPHAERCRRMSSSPAVCSRVRRGLAVRGGIHADHNGSQSKPAKPSTTKNGRHPKRPTAVPPSHIPSPGPNAKPASIIALAKPPATRLKYANTTLLYHRKPPDSLR